MTARPSHNLPSARFFLAVIFCTIFSFFLMGMAAPVMAQVHSSQCSECDPLADKAKELQKVAKEASDKQMAAIAAEKTAVQNVRDAQAKADQATQDKYKFINQASEQRAKVQAEKEKQEQKKQQRIKEIGKEIDKITADMKALQDKHDAMGPQIEAAQHAAQQAEENIQGYQDEADKAQAALQAANEALQAASLTANSTIQSYERDENRTTQNQAVRDARQAVNDARKELDRATQQLEQAKQRAEKAKQHVKDLQNERDSIPGQYNALRAKRDNLEAERQALMQAKDNGNGFDEAAYEQKLAELEAAERYARGQVDQANNALTAAQEAVSQAIKEASDAHAAYNAAYHAWESCMDDCRKGKHKRN